MAGCHDLQRGVVAGAEPAGPAGQVFVDVAGGLAALGDGPDDDRLPAAAVAGGKDARLRVM